MKGILDNFKCAVHVVFALNDEEWCVGGFFFTFALEKSLSHLHYIVAV